MKAPAIVVCSILACGLLLAVLPRSEVPDDAELVSAWPADPLDLLPESTVLAVELRDVADRWDEIRALEPIARFQDRVLGALGIDPAELPRALGSRAAIALVADAAWSSLHPVAALRPPDLHDALRLLEELEHRAATPLVVEQHGEFLTIASESVARAVQQSAAQRRSEARTPLRIADVDARLPDGGLVRGWFNSRGAARLLRNLPNAVRSDAEELAVDLILAELDVIRFAGFRRELGQDGIVSDAVIGVDTAALPEGVRRIFRSPKSERVLPATLPSGVAALLAFGTEPDAVLAWMHHVAQTNPRGPLRNLAFWLDEIAASTGVVVRTDLLGLLGERAWLALLSGTVTPKARFVVISETQDAQQLERNLLLLRSWMTRHVASRTLGLVVPRATLTHAGDRSIHGISWRTPFGELRGPQFAVSEEHLILGNGEDAVTTGAELLQGIRSWADRPAAFLGAPAPNESALASGPELAKLLDTLIRSELSRSAADLPYALVELLAGLDEITIDVWYEADAVRLHGRLSSSP